jgi:hypothetical protein
MRARSWMAVLALVVGTSIAAGRAMPALESSQAPEKGQSAETKKVSPRTQNSDPKRIETRVPSVQLNLKIAGLGAQGCDVQVKPGNASCKFRPVYDQRTIDRQHVPADGSADLELRDVELRGADRTITIAITIREPGLASKTFYRGFRLATKPEVGKTSRPGSVPAFTCFLTSPSKLAKADESRARK